ncbi:hypothetical protein [Sphingomonas sp. M1-B02]|uniref:hypothetical protein n=1 Tax=Sphingomonas sp. M1-B02 TaxID=3114300 RepID=UPI00223EDCAF|nr:hypothetical protein [Sphingomonas sp. S6-11]UZK67831.1 hypothetical protein OKW87_08430 [Sphingomonas sp. S6-11]
MSTELICLLEAFTDLRLVDADAGLYDPSSGRFQAHRDLGRTAAIESFTAGQLLMRVDRPRKAYGWKEDIRNSASSFRGCDLFQMRHDGTPAEAERDWSVLCDI